MSRQNKSVETPKLGVSTILDRLIDDDPEQHDELEKSKNQTLLNLYLGVRRDLENIFNTRRRCISWDKELSELEISLVDYGIPDLMGTKLNSQNLQEKFCKYLERVINRYEPRFKQVNIAMSQHLEKQDRVLRIHIDGLLYAEPAPEPVTFDFTVEPETCSVYIAEG